MRNIKQQCWFQKDDGNTFTQESLCLAKLQTIRAEENTFRHGSTYKKINFVSIFFNEGYYGMYFRKIRMKREKDDYSRSRS